MSRIEPVAYRKEVGQLSQYAAWVFGMNWSIIAIYTVWEKNVIM